MAKKPPKEPTLRDRIEKELNEFPAGYDAHKDRLADKWDHEESVNKLMALLKDVRERAFVEKWETSK